MAEVITDQTHRKYLLKRPEGWKPKLPRWLLKLPDTANELAITYIGVQARSENTNLGAGISAVESWIKTCANPPAVIDRFEVVSGRDQVNTRVWACYWTNRAQAMESIHLLNLRAMYSGFDAQSQSSLGLWKETIVPDLTRFETNYSGDDYRPGLAQLQGAQQLPHELTGYWGAARDRIYASAYDDLSGAGPTAPRTKQVPSFDGENIQFAHSKGTNGATIAHIRSGQFWEDCSEAEREAYETDLEPFLRQGLDDIYKRPEDLGDYGLRFLRNVTRENTVQRRETCAAGFFRSLADLESWAKDCPSHHRIYGGSIQHRRRFGKDAKMRTWHEIAILKPGEASWEYLNCLPDTGTLSFQPSQRVH